MKSGNLNFLEPSGPLQACNGTALPLPLPFTFQQVFRAHRFICSMLERVQKLRRQRNWALVFATPYAWPFPLPSIVASSDRQNAATAPHSLGWIHKRQQQLVRSIYDVW